MSAEKLSIQLSLHESKERKEDAELDPPISISRPQVETKRRKDVAEADIDAPMAISRHLEAQADDLLMVKADNVLVFNDTLLKDKAVPADCQTLEYHLFDDNNFEKLDKKALEEKIEKDFKALKEILIKFPQISKLVVREMALSDVYRKNKGYDHTNWSYYFRRLFFGNKIAMVWYNSLIELIKDTRLTAFELKNLGAQNHPNGNGSDKCYHYGPTDPIDFCEKLFKSGIRSLDLATSTFSSFLPSVVVYNRLFEVGACTETCNIGTVLCCIPNLLCMLTALCCCVNPSKWTCCNKTYGNTDLVQLEANDQQYFERVLTTLSKFTSLQVSFFQMLRSMSEVRRARPGSQNPAVNLHIHKLWKESPFRRLIIDDFGAISNAGTLRASELDIVKAIQVICQNDQLQEFQLGFPYLFCLSETAIESVGQALALSHIQKLYFAQALEINFFNAANADVASTVSKCAVLVRNLKDNKHFIECLILPSTLGWKVTNALETAPALFKSFVGVLNDLQAMIAKRLLPLLLQKMVWDDARKSIIDQLHQNKTMHNILENRKELLEQGITAKSDEHREAFYGEEDRDRECDTYKEIRDAAYEFLAKERGISIESVKDMKAAYDEVNAFLSEGPPVPDFEKVKADELRGNEKKLLKDLEKRLQPEYITKLEEMLSVGSGVTPLSTPLARTVLYYAGVRKDPSAGNPKENCSVLCEELGVTREEFVEQFGQKFQVWRLKKKA